MVSLSTVMPAGRIAASASRKMVRAGGIVSRFVFLILSWLKIHQRNLMT